MERHSQNALEIAKWLEARSDVTKVHYAGLESSKWHERSAKYLPNGNGAIVAFELAGGIEAGKSFINNLELVSHLANIGDAKTLVIHPASTTHQQMSDDQLDAAGIGADLIRLSVGLEDLDDIVWDLDRALRSVS